MIEQFWKKASASARPHVDTQSIDPTLRHILGFNDDAMHEAEASTENFRKNAPTEDPIATFFKAAQTRAAGMESVCNVDFRAMLELADLFGAHAEMKKILNGKEAISFADPHVLKLSAQQREEMSASFNKRSDLRRQLEKLYAQVREYLSFDEEVNAAKAVAALDISGFMQISENAIRRAKAAA